ncbi:MAG: glycine cleavage system protein GcvH [Bacillota bacterium]
MSNLYFSKDHEWIKVNGDIAEVGITDFAQHQLGEIVYVELPFVDDELEKGDVFGVLESVKAASDSYSPVDGIVTEVNEILEVQPELINEKPFESWIYKMEISDKSQLEDLLNEKEYKEFCGKEE